MNIFLKILSGLVVVLAIGGGYMYWRMSQSEYPRVANYVSTIIDSPIQTTYKSLVTDFGHQSDWYSSNKKQEMVTPPPDNAVGSIRIMNGIGPTGKGVKLWEKLVAADPEKYSWAYSCLDYNESTIKYSPIPPFYDHRTDSTMYPITTHGNTACFLEWVITQNSPIPLKLLDVENVLIFKGFFHDLEVYLDKSDEKSSNPLFAVKDIDSKTVRLLVRQGTVITHDHNDLWKKSKNLRNYAINVKEDKDDHFPKSYEVVSDVHSSLRTFRNVVISGQGKAQRFNVPHKSLTYVSMDDTFILEKSADNDAARTAYVTQVQEAFATFVKELEK